MEESQLINYRKAAGLEGSLLLNFGTRLLNTAVCSFPGLRHPRDLRIKNAFQS